MGDSNRKSTRQRSSTTWILAGLVLGVVWGLFWGEYGSWVGWIGDAFVGLMQTTVLPYVAISLVCSVGRLSAVQGRRLARIAFGVLLLLWGIGLLTLMVMSLSFPPWKGGSFFSTSLVQEPVTPDWLELFIPSNPFFSLANNLVPAVVLFSIGLGVALMRVPNAEPLLEKLDILLRGLGELNRLVVRLAPLGIFGIVGHTAGTLSFEEFELLQGYLIVYGLAAVVLCVWVLPATLACCTPFTEREILASVRDMLITSFIIGNTFVVLPLIVDAVKGLLARHASESADEQNTPEYAVQLAYPFPDVGRIMVMVFIPFAAWFYGGEIDSADYPQLVGVGFIGAFAKPVVTVPLLLELAEVPGDIFNLFLAVGVIASRFGDSMKCMHLFAFSILTASIVSGAARFNLRRLASRGLISLLLLTALVVAIRAGLKHSFTPAYERGRLISARQLLGVPVRSEIIRQAAPHPAPLAAEEDRMDRILRDGVLRIGIHPAKLPFTYYNSDGNLVGLDIDMAHQMARDLGDVRIQFVHYSGNITDALRADHFDLAMSGLEGTIQRAIDLPEMEPYLEVTRALVVPDHRRREFRSLSHLKNALEDQEPLRVAVITDLGAAGLPSAETALGTGWGAVTSSGLDQRLELVGVEDASRFFAEYPRVADVLATSAEAGSAWTLRYPEFAVVKPSGLDVRSPLYFLAAEPSRFVDFVNSWLKLKRRDGTIDQLYQYWILGKSPAATGRRWCVIRNVLQWVE